MARSRGKHNSRFRRFSEALFITSLLGGRVTQWSYRCGLHGKLRVTRYEFRLPDENQLPRPVVLAFASDLHAGPTTYPATFSTLANELNELRPDVLLLGGDYVTGEATNIHALTDALSSFEPPLGKYGVLGNHDLWTDDGYIREQLASAGVMVLVNSNRALPPPFDTVSICGIDDPWTGNADVRKAFEGAGPVRVFLTHSPDGMLLLRGQHFNVGLAGHTHGGQVAFPNGTPILSAGGPLARTYGRGRFEIAGNGPLIVSRGIGCSNLPIRLNADPELVVCTLSS